MASNCSEVILFFNFQPKWEADTCYHILVIMWNRLSLSVFISAMVPPQPKTHTHTHTLSCFTLTEFTTPTVYPRGSKGGKRLLYVSNLGQSGEEGNHFPLLWRQSVKESWALWPSAAALTGTRDEGRMETSLKATRRERVMAGLMKAWSPPYVDDSLLSFGPRGLPLSHKHRAEDGWTLMTPQVFPPMSRCGTLSYL